MKLSGIDRNFRVTDGKAGFIERDPATGEPTGIIRSCLRFVKRGGAARSPTEIASRGRPCISHCNFMSREAIETMERLGVVADLQPPWLFLDGATLRAHFGDARLAWFQPYRTIFDRGVTVGGGSDHMQKIGARRAINTYHPFLAMWTTITRQPRWTDQPLHPEQRISRQEAIRFYTIDNAFLTFEEKEKGSLEKGKLADFIVIDRDILACPEDAIREIEVEQTWLGGKRVSGKADSQGRRR